MQLSTVIIPFAAGQQQSPQGRSKKPSLSLTIPSSKQSKSSQRSANHLGTPFVKTPSPLSLAFAAVSPLRTSTRSSSSSSSTRKSSSSSSSSYVTSITSSQPLSSIFFDWDGDDIQSSSSSRYASSSSSSPCSPRDDDDGCAQYITIPSTSPFHLPPPQSHSDESEECGSMATFACGALLGEGGQYTAQLFHDELERRMAPFDDDDEEEDSPSVYSPYDEDNSTVATAGTNIDELFSELCFETTTATATTTTASICSSSSSSSRSSLSSPQQWKIPLLSPKSIPDVPCDLVLDDDDEDDCDDDDEEDEDDDDECDDDDDEQYYYYDEDDCCEEFTFTTSPPLAKRLVAPPLNLDDSKAQRCSASSSVPPPLLCGIFA